MLASVYAKYDALAQIEVAELTDIFLIKQCLRGRAEICQDRATIMIRAGQAVLLSANQATTLMLSADFIEQTVKIHASVVARVFYEEYGVELPLDFCFGLQAIDAELMTHISQLSEMLERGLVEQNAGAEQYLSQMICALLLRQHPHNYEAMTHNNPTHALDTLTHYIQKNSSLELTMATLEQVSQLNQRTIQLLFKSQMQLTPSQYVRQVRLEKVRAILQTQPHAKISEIALQEGFSHLGRFAHYYKEAFGELPQHTVRPRS